MYSKFKRIGLNIVSLFVLTSFILHPLATLAESPYAFTSKANLWNLNESANTKQNDLLDKHVSQAGAFSNVIAIDVLAGPGGFVPNYSIRYSSQNTDNHFTNGYGWSDSLPYIERQNLSGTNKMYEENYFLTSQNGVLIASTTDQQNFGMYVPEVQDGEHVRYVYDLDNSWKQYMNDGTIHEYANTASSTIAHDSTGSKVARWYITKSIDSNGNVITYSYDKSGNKPYINSIQYGPNSIDFTYVSSLPYTSYEFALELTTDKQVSQITLSKNATDLKTYMFNYTVSSDSGRSLLSDYEIEINKNGQIETYAGEQYQYNVSNASFSVDYSQPDFPITGDRHLYKNFKNQFPITVRDTNNNGISEMIGYAGGANSTHSFKYEWNNHTKQWEGTSNNDPDANNWSYYFSNDILFGFTNDDTYLDNINTNGSSAIIAGDFNGDGYTDLLSTDDDYPDTDLYDRTQNEHIEHKTGYWDNYGEGPDKASHLHTPDINSDGLADIATRNSIRINKGNGQEKYIATPYSISSSIDEDQRMKAVYFADFNGDKLLDIATANYGNIGSNSSSNIRLQRIDGSFVSTNLGQQIESFADVDGDDLYATGAWFQDIDGDGLVDMMISRDGSTGEYMYWNNSNHADTMKSVTTKSGGIVEPTYKMTSEQYGTNDELLNPDLNTPIMVVNSITLHNGVSDPVLVNYSYANGLNHTGFRKKKFAGFETITRTSDDTNTKTVLWYHQGNGQNALQHEPKDSYAHIGKEYKRQTINLDDNTLENEIINLYVFDQLPNSSTILRKNSVVNRQPNNSEYIDTATEHVRSSSHGMVVEKTEYGFVDYVPEDQRINDTGDDKRETVYEYAVADNILSRNILIEEYIRAEDGLSMRTNNYRNGGTVPDITDHYDDDRDFLSSHNGDFGLYTYRSRVRFERTHLSFPTEQIELAGRQVASATVELYAKRGRSDSPSSFKLFDGTCGETSNYRKKTTCGTNNIPITSSVSLSNRNSYELKNLPLNPTGLSILSSNLGNKETSFTIRSYNDYNRIFGSDGGIISGGLRDINIPDLRPQFKITFIDSLVMDLSWYKVARQTDRSSKSAKVTETEYIYDGQPSGIISKGNITRLKEWLNTDNIFVDTQFAYDSHGNIISKTDSRSNTTNYTYDPDGIHITEIVNSKGHITNYIVDQITGERISSTDPNGLITAATYDGLGRMLSESKTSSDGTLTVVATYSYDDMNIPRSVSKNTYKINNPQTSKVYKDGFGKTIQQKVLNTNNSFSTVSYEYDSRGRLLKKSLPYSTNQISYSNTVPSNVLWKSYSYDSSDRVIAIQSPTGTETTSYSGTEKTITNRNGYSTTYDYDAYGNLIAVTEDIQTNSPQVSTSTDPDPSPYQYKQKVTIAGSTGAGTDYQILLKIGKDSNVTGADFHLSGNSEHFPQTRNDGGDLFFYSSDETTELSFWVENVENDLAYVWVKVSDNLDADQDIYVYYGNENSINYSDGESTFEFFDEFESNVLDDNKWHVENGLVNISSGIASLNNSGSSYASFITKEEFGPQTATRFVGRIAQTSVGYHQMGYRCGFTSDSIECGSNHQGNAAFYSRWENDPIGQVKAAGNDNQGAYQSTANFVNAHQLFEVRRPNDNNQKFYLNNALVASDGKTLTNNLSFVTTQYHTGKNGNNEIDWVIVRKNIDVEPSYSSSNGEEAVAAVHNKYYVLAQVASDEDIDLGDPTELEESIENTQDEIQEIIDSSEAVASTSPVITNNSETVSSVTVNSDSDGTSVSATTDEDVNVIRVETTEPSSEVVSNNVEASDETPSNDDSVLEEDIATVEQEVVETTLDESVSPTIDIDEEDEITDIADTSSTSEIEQLPITEDIPSFATTTASSSLGENSEDEEIFYIPEEGYVLTQPAKSYRHKELVWVRDGRLTDREAAIESIKNKLLVKKQSRSNINLNIQKKRDRVSVLRKTISKRKEKGRSVSDQTESIKRQQSKIDQLKQRRAKVNSKIDRLQNILTKKKNRINSSNIKRDIDSVDEIIEHSEQSATTSDRFSLEAFKILITSLFKVPTAFASSWADTRYEYKQSLTVNGQTNAGTDHQILVKVGKDATIADADVHLFGNASHFPYETNDGGDLAFYGNDDQTLLPFWVERVENDTAYVWVKVLDDLSVNTDINLYYGYDTPNNYSNGEATFELFEGMQTNLSSSDWSFYRTNGSVQNGELVLNAKKSITSNNSYSDGYGLLFAAKLPGYQEAAGFNNARFINHSSYGNNKVLVNNNRYVPGSLVSQDYKSFQINKTAGQQEFYVDGDLVHAGNDNLSNSRVNFFDRSSNNTNNINSWLRITSLAVRKIADNEFIINANQEPLSQTANQPLQEVVETSGLFTTNYIYDSRNNLIKINDAENNVRTFEYDSLGRQTKATLPYAPSATNTATFMYGYDSNGNMTSKTYPDGSVINYAYDSLNRLLTKDSSQTAVTDVTYAYDDAGSKGIGKLHSVTGDEYVKVYSYDQSGAMSAESVTIDDQSHTTLFNYNNYGLQTDIFYPDSTHVSYTYHLDGSVDTISRDTVPVIDGTDYNHLGQITNQAYANGTDQSYVYDANMEYRLISKTIVNGSSTALEDISYQYDSLGNITNIVNTGTVSQYDKQYGYDSVNRLTSATSTINGTDSIESYSYSPTGNVLRHNGTQYLYDNTTFPQAATTFGSSTYTYDQNGNLSSKDDGSVISTFTYDWNDRLGNVQEDGTTIADYTYTDARQRLSKTTDGSTKWYINNQTEYDGTDYQNYIFAGNNRIATLNTDGITYNHTDHLQSSSLETNQSGSVTSALTYTPFGFEESSTGTKANDYTYTNQERDGETGLMYYDARYYDAELKRFMSVDPIAIENVMRAVNAGPQTLNPYSYVSNNPLKYNDPSGEWFKEVLTGKQSWSDFQLEVGQATHQMTNNSPTWDYAVSNPKTAGAAVGVVGGVSAVPATAAAAAYSSSIVTVSGVGKTLVTNRLVEGSIYSYLTAEGLRSTRNLINSMANLDVNNISTVGDFAWEAGTIVTPAFLGETPGAVYDVYDLTSSIIDRLVGHGDKEN